jgi:hypothetical protein
MSAFEFLTNVTIIAGVMALGALLEMAVPMFIARRGRDGRGRVLGTFTPSDRAASVIYGLDDDRGSERDSLPRLLAMPFDPDEKVTVATAAPR